MRYISLFAGIGGFDLALNRLGHTCVYANDFDKYAAITYNKNFIHRIDTTSITDVPAAAIPGHDLLVGGFPCQTFSIAGKRRGFDETRGTLFFDIARILKHHRTKYFILENVKGLTNHDGGRTFRVVLRTLAELGYDLQWQVLNSKDFGVPQNRERVFIVGYLRGEPRFEVFPLTEHNPETNVSYAIDANYYKGINTGSEGGRSSFQKMKRQMVGTFPYIRRLTPIECERLQGFPDNWTQGVSDTQRYKQLGNAVTVNVVQAIASHLPLEITGSETFTGDEQ